MSDASVSFLQVKILGVETSPLPEFEDLKRIQHPPTLFKQSSNNIKQSEE